MSFADLKNKSGSFDALQAELKKIESPTSGNSFEDNRFWKPDLDKTGNGYAILRFLPQPQGEDLLSLVMGLNGQKGRVILRLGTPLNGEFESAEKVAAEIDRQIISNLQLFPINYWAMSRLEDPAYQSLSHLVPTIEKKESLAFTQRLKSCPPEYRPYWLKMYANPVLNRERVLNSGPNIPTSI